MKLKFKLGSNHWFDHGQICIALMIDFLDDQVTVRLITNEAGTPFLEPLSSFEIISGHIPSSWVFFQDDTGVSLTPAAWTAQNFWHHFYDGEDQERAIFEREHDHIVAEEP